MSVTHLPGTYAAAAAATLGALTGCSASGADLRTAMEAVCDGGSIAGEGDDLDYWITDVVQSADSYPVAWAVGRDGGDYVVLTVVDLDDRTGILQPLEDEGFEVGLDDPVGVPS